MKNNTLKFVPYANKVVKGKFIELNACIRKEVFSQLRFQLKNLGK